VHDFVHTVMFVQAAGTVRRVLDPNHRDYGDVKGYYARVGRAAEVVVPAWRDYLDGRIDREAAVERIVAGFSLRSLASLFPAFWRAGSLASARPCGAEQLPTTGLFLLC
jgi:hypothetical protein